MNTTKKTIVLAIAAGALLAAGAKLTTNLISLPSTYELAFGTLVFSVLVGLAIAEFRMGTPRRMNGIGLRRLSRQRFRNGT